SRCAATGKAARRSGCCRWRGCSPRRSCGSRTRTRYRRSSWSSEGFPAGAKVFSTGEAWSRVRPQRLECIMQIELSATKRAGQGTGASRRLRHTGRVPGILYGGGEAPLTIELDHNELYLQARREAFHASIINLSLDGQKQQVLLRAINMHPWKAQVQHVDFQRVRADQKIHMKVPLHFVNAEVSPAVKEASAVINHVMNDNDLTCQ